MTMQNHLCSYLAVGSDQPALALRTRKEESVPNGIVKMEAPRISIAAMDKLGRDMACMAQRNRRTTSKATILAQVESLKEHRILKEQWLLMSGRRGLMGNRYIAINLSQAKVQAASSLTHNHSLIRDCCMG